MKLSRFTKIGMAAVGVLFLAWLALTLLSGNVTQKSGPAVADEKHCPRCGRELPRWAWGTDQCPYCQLEEKDGGAASGSPRPRFRSAAPSAVIPTLLVVAFAALLTVHLVMLVRTRVVVKTEEVLYHLNCPKCGRKLRYRVSQAGRLGQCPLCRRPVIFPRVEGPAPSGWAKMRRWLRMA
jgi:predicted RNA-binding Zn-ribbon protein involved in translation (DUF1610 family)